MCAGMCAKVNSDPLNHIFSILVKNVASFFMVEVSGMRISSLAKKSIDKLSIISDLNIILNLTKTT